MLVLFILIGKIREKMIQWEKKLKVLFRYIKFDMFIRFLSGIVMQVIGYRSLKFKEVDFGV